MNLLFSPLVSTGRAVIKRFPATLRQGLRPNFCSIGKHPE
jgi:hypothetical protein